MKRKHFFLQKFKQENIYFFLICQKRLINSQATYNIQYTIQYTIKYTILFTIFNIQYNIQHTIQ